MEIHRLKKEYTLFVNDFVRWANVAGATVHVPAGSNVSVTDLGDGQIEVKSLFHLSDWPFKGASKRTNGNLTVLVQTREIYEAGHVLVKSNVCMQYFMPTKKGQPLTPSIAINYDYKYRMEQAHPIFHAQFGARDITPAELRSVRFDRTLDISPYKPISSIRLPTVHVGLPAALLALVADHLSRDAYAGLLETAKKNVFFNKVAALRLDHCRDSRLHTQDQYVFRSHTVYN
jgi:hypothetical protein